MTYDMIDSRHYDGSVESEKEMKDWFFKLAMERKFQIGEEDGVLHIEPGVTVELYGYGLVVSRPKN